MLLPTNKHIPFCKVQQQQADGERAASTGPFENNTSCFSAHQVHDTLKTYYIQAK